jgi:peptidyl-prolyl cis-trans isomerase D
LLVRAASVTKGNIKPLSEVEPLIRQEAALSKAKALTETLHDQIEDMRASARPLADIAKDKNLSLVTLSNIDAQGLDDKGARNSLPEASKLLGAVFQSDIGVDNEALRLAGGGYYWFEITKIDLARERTQEEAAADLLATWRNEQISKKLADTSRSLIEKLDKGEAFADLARPLGLKVQKAEGLGRGGAQGDLSLDIIPAIFSTALNKAGSAAESKGENRVLFRVTASEPPPYITSTQAAQTLQNTLRTALSDDVISAYGTHLQSLIGVEINENVLQRLSGLEN